MVSGQKDLIETIILIPWGIYFFMFHGIALLSYNKKVQVRVLDAITKDELPWHVAWNYKMPVELFNIFGGVEIAVSISLFVLLMFSEFPEGLSLWKLVSAILVNSCAQIGIGSILMRYQRN